MSIRTRSGLKQFEAEFAEQERQKELDRTAPIRAAAQHSAQLEQEILEVEKQIVRDSIFNEPSEHLSTVCTAYKKNLTVAQVQVAIGNAVAALKLHLDEQGKEITASGLLKIGRISELNKDIDTTESKNLITVFEYLETNGCFNSSDVKIVRQIQPAAEQVRAAKRTVEVVQAELDALRDTDTPVGRIKAMKLKGELLSLEVINSGLWAQWCAFVRENYDPFDSAEQEKCTQWLADNDLLLNVPNLNKYRRFRGWRDADEELSRTIEQHEGKLDDYQTRKDIAQRIRRIQGN